MAAAEAPPFLIEAMALLAAAVVAVPVARRAGLGTVLGYLAAGIAIGPHGAGIISDAEGVLRIAELGVVLLLFVIGLELRPARLWRMRRDIFGLGTAQVLLTGGVLTLMGLPVIADWRIATVAGFGMALSSTAFALQIMQERGHLSTSYGQRAFAILLLQDIAIVPLLAAVALMSPVTPDAVPTRLGDIILPLATIGAVVLIGRFAINPLFALLARWGAREVMLIAALLVAFGSALALLQSGLSMALGAFIAGVLLAESSYRHTLEADIEPFRSLLMGLFFIAVGMSFDIDVLLRSWVFILSGVVLVMTVKGLLLWALTRTFGSSNSDALRIAVTLPQGGEFAFVLFSAAAASALMREAVAIQLTAIVILTMVMTPLVGAVYDRIAARLRARGVAAEVVEGIGEAKSCVLIAGFGRFGMVAAQMLTSEGIDVIAIDNRPDRISHARKLGYRIFYGDATRADVMRAAGAGDAVVIALCIERDEIMNRAVSMIREEFPEARIFCRATDRAHAISLMRQEVDFHIRETFESSIVFGRAALAALDIPADRIADIEQDVRHRDDERLQIQVQEGFYAGTEILHARTPRPLPGGEEES